MESSESPLRQFLYLDIPLVTDLLSQLEGGSYDSETRTTGETRSRGLKGEIGVGIPFVSLKGGGGKDKASREEVQRTVERTDTVRFAQLYRLLMDQAKIQELATVDQEIWERLEPSEFVEIQAIVTPSSVAKTVARLAPSGRLLAALYWPVLEGRPAVISFVTVAELEYGARLADWGPDRLRRLVYEVGWARRIRHGK